MSHGYILYFVLIFLNLVALPKTNLDPVEFGWNSVDSVLLPNMYYYTTRDVHCYLWLQEKMHRKMSVQQVWRFMRRILQVHWRRMVYLSLPLESVGHCIRYANIKIFSEPHFPIYGQNLRTYTPIFYPGWRISLISPESDTSLNKSNGHYTENK